MKRFLKFLLFCAAVFALIRIALYDGLTVRRYEITSAYVSESHTFAVLTDLHSTVYGENQDALAAKIRSESPEAVFLVGDIADDKRGFDGTRLLLDRLADVPMYYVTGNHERWVEWTEDVQGLFAAHGVTVTENVQFDLGDGIRLSGLADPLFYEDTGAYLAALDALETDGKFDILLAHRPEFAEQYADAGFELSLSGHAHGGQVRIPLLLNGLYAPNQGWFPEYAGGRYDFAAGTAVVSRGLMLDDLPRVFNPPEVVVITVSPAD